MVLFSVRWMVQCSFFSFGLCSFSFLYEKSGMFFFQLVFVGSDEVRWWDFPEHCTGHTSKYECPIEIYGFYASIVKSTSRLPAGKLHFQRCASGKRARNREEMKSMYVCVFVCVYVRKSERQTINTRVPYTMCKLKSHCDKFKKLTSNSVQSFAT